jgi:cell division control protein 7
MAQTEIVSHRNHDQASLGAYQPSEMEAPQSRQLVEDDENGAAEADSYDEYEDEDEDDIDDSVIEDMRKLEESFKGISQKYKLINRIGEGIVRKLS